MRKTQKVCLAIGFIFALGLPAPPGRAYEGYTPLTGGGDGGAEVWVTDLADSGAGTLREALGGLDGSATVIKFGVGGTINLTAALSLTKANVTIAGETAPAPGITLNGATIGGLEAILEVNTHDVIIRHLRFRDSGKEGIQIFGDYNIIVDHCSITGSADGACDVNGGVHHFTFSRNLLADNVECHRSYGNSASFHHNLYTYNNRRQPKIVTGTGPYDFRNNVVEYWTNTGTNVQGAGA